jgi:hypothetical protein
MHVIDGKKTKVGDIVYFKSDIEQCGKVTALCGDGSLDLTRDGDYFSGDYIGHQTEHNVDADDCWRE